MNSLISIYLSVCRNFNFYVYHIDYFIKVKYQFSKVFRETVNDFTILLIGEQKPYPFMLLEDFLGYVTILRSRENDTASILFFK